ncbi:MAG: hypothetical protein B6U94_03995 [Thermofilum sp. ex4484_79]|nr:MAG: hypothetical protein B6U94_03995 [Thermofilum sp. ex4484_79]
MILMTFEELEEKIKETLDSMKKLVSEKREEVESLLDEVDLKVKENRLTYSDLLEYKNKLKFIKREIILRLKSEYGEVVRDTKLSLWKLLRSIRDPEKRRSLRERFDEIIEEFEEQYENILDEWDDYMDDCIETLSELSSIVKKGKTTSFSIFIRGPRGRIVNPLESVDEAISRITEAMEKTFDSMNRMSRELKYKQSSVISSIRLPSEDIGIIDLLVDSGLFKSRSEAVAFFTHKGILSSKEWLEKIREKLEEIRKLQEGLKEDLWKIVREKKEDSQS